VTQFYVVLSCKAEFESLWLLQYVNVLEFASRWNFYRWFV